MRTASLRLAALIAPLVFPAVGRCGFIDLLSSTKLNADVNASLTRASDKVSDSHSSHDVGSLSKENASASASATLPISAGVSALTTGTANSMLSGSGNTFHLTGSAASNLPLNCPFDALTQSVSTVNIPFTIASGGKATLDYALNVSAMVQNDEKVTFVLNRTGQPNAIVSHVFAKNTSGSVSLPEAGSYNLLVIAGAQSTTKGIAGESGTAAFDISLAASSASTRSGGGSTTIPLPPAVAPARSRLAGQAMLGARPTNRTLVFDHRTKNERRRHDRMPAAFLLAKRKSCLLGGSGEGHLLKQLRDNNGIRRIGGIRPLGGAGVDVVEGFHGVGVEGLAIDGVG